MHLICFSHLRWNFVYQRPQHLISRFAKEYETYYIEEFINTEHEDGYSYTITPDRVLIVTPQLKVNDTTGRDEHERLRNVITQLFEDCEIKDYICWYYTPMALAFTDQLTPQLTVFDCMDELSAFKFAPPELKEYERKLLATSDLVFTGGNSLFQAKRHSNPNVFPFPSSIDKKHFGQARDVVQQPHDQVSIAHPRLGFFGVIDERFDAGLIREAAAERPEWNFIILGPIVKIDPNTLPKAANIHYLGSKSYQELPLYLNGWDIALIPFLINESTRFISPTKTPEYLAAGKPVISTPITDVIDPYLSLGLVHIVHNASEFLAVADDILSTGTTAEWLHKVDSFLSTISWDKTWQGMHELIQVSLNKKLTSSISKNDIYV